MSVPGTVGIIALVVGCILWLRSNPIPRGDVFLILATLGPISLGFLVVASWSPGGSGSSGFAPGLIGTSIWRTLTGSPRRSRCGLSNGIASLKTICTAQYDFRSNDRDRDGEQNFWTGDIAGLYALSPGNDPQGYPLRLIELSIATADADPVTDLSHVGNPAPSSGFWYRAFDRRGGTNPYSQFAACAFPARYGDPWRDTFIISEDTVIYRKDLGHADGVFGYPDDPEAEGWSKLN